MVDVDIPKRSDDEAGRLVLDICSSKVELEVILDRNNGTPVARQQCHASHSNITQSTRTNKWRQQS